MVLSPFSVRSLAVSVGYGYFRVTFVIAAMVYHCMYCMHGTVIEDRRSMSEIRNESSRAKRERPNVNINVALLWPKLMSLFTIQFAEASPHQYLLRRESEAQRQNAGTDETHL